MANRIGQRLGNYRLTRLLGQGGFADVYLGEHIHLNTRAALKVLQMRLAGSNLDEFRNEARTIATLIHPHIIRILDFGEEEGTPFLVMDYAPNGSLRHRYPKGTRLPPEQIVFYLKQAASALHYAHAQKLIHRDVKPENILLSQDGNVLLSDFGLVLVAQSTGSQLTLEAAGTLPYMAPEQLQGRPRPASDQYGLGIIVYEWICGERPFQGGPVELMGQHALTPPPSLLQRVPGLPPAVEAVVFRALDKDPQQRFANIEEFASAFEAACQGSIGPQGQLPDGLSFFDQSAIATYISPTGNPTPLYGIPVDEQSLQSTLLHTPVLPMQETWSSSPSFASTYVHTPSQPVNSQSASPAVSPSRSDVISGPTSFTGATTPQSPVASNMATGPTVRVPGNREVIFPTHIASSPYASGPVTPLPTEQVVIHAPKKARRSGKRLWLIAVLLLIVLLAGTLAGLSFTRSGGLASLFNIPNSTHGSGSLHNAGGQGAAVTPTAVTVTPTGATSATVAITPASRDLKQTYTIIAVTGTPDAAQQQVQARVLSSTSPAQSKTVPATGQGTTPGTRASGILTILSLDGTTQTFNADQTFDDEPGRPNVQIVIDASVTVSSANSSVDVPAHIAQVGVVGNIAAQDFCSPVCGASPGASWRAFNNAAFTGGQDAQPYTAVAQSDIDGATGALVSSLTPGTQSAVQSQVSANEHAAGNPQCSHQTNADHHAGDQATSVTVTVIVACTLESYDYNGALLMAAQLLSSQAAGDPGTGYALRGHVANTLAQVVVADANRGTLNLTVNSEGIWVYSFTADQQQAFKAYMAGKSKAVVLAWLSNQPGVSQASIQIPDGDGNTFPGDPGKIVIKIQGV